MSVGLGPSLAIFSAEDSPSSLLLSQTIFALSSLSSLTNLSLGYQFDKFEASLWVHNLFNKYYSVRGFYFGNEPPNFEDTLYERHGDPRRFGLSLQYDL